MSEKIQYSSDSDEFTRPLSYYTTCTFCDEEKGEEVELEGIGEYHPDSNTLYLLPCHKCGESMEVTGWLDECEECLEYHYESEECGKEWTRF
jgi:hypothetical protein